MLSKTYYFNKILDTLYPGEYINKRLCFYFLVGSLFNNFQTILVLGDYSEILKLFINSILKVFPQDIIQKFDGTSRRDLTSLNLNGKKILWITDFEKNRALINAITETDEEGVIYNKKLRIPKYSIISFTEEQLFLKNKKISDSIITLELNSSMKQTKALSKFDLKKMGLKKKVSQNDIEGELTLLRDFLQGLEKDFSVEISFKNFLKSCFNYIIPGATIKHRIFEKLIKNVTLVNQKDRIIYQNKDNHNKIKNNCVFTEPVDLKYVWSIGKEKFSNISEDLPKDQLNFLNYIFKWVELAELQSDTKKNQYYPLKKGYHFRKELIDSYLNHLDKNNLDKHDKRTYITYFQLFADPKNKLNYIAEEKQGLYNIFKLIKAPPLKPFNYYQIKKDIITEHFQHLRNFKEEFNAEF
ncbi:MAG: hypothetical protein ACFFAQ_01920 [Promethearchaeota archaeon]